MRDRRQQVVFFFDDPAGFVPGLFQGHMGIDTRQQLRGAERLGDVVDRALAQPADGHLAVVGRSKKDDGDVLSRRVLLQTATSFDAVHFGHHDVQQDQIGFAGLHPLQGRRATGGQHHLVMLVGQKLAQQLEVFFQIVHDQHHAVAAAR